MTGEQFKAKLASLWAYIKRTAKKVWEYLKAAKMEWIVLVSVFAVDLISKAVVEANLIEGEAVPFIPYVFNIHRLSNYEAVFGSNIIKKWLGGIGARIFFCVFAVAASVAFVLVLIKQKGKSRFFRVGIALFVAGAMGNCIDRMFLGYVRDFIEFVYFGLTISGRTSWQYIFNLADVALIAGVIMIIIHLLFFYKDTDKKKNEELLHSDVLADNQPTDASAAPGEEADPGESDAAQDITQEVSDTESVDQPQEMPETEDSGRPQDVTDTENIEKPPQDILETEDSDKTDGGEN